jgi:O-antigen/teichoic acid export membrane protein
LDFFLVALSRGAGAVFAFVANVIIARLLGPSEFGVYVTVLSAGLVAGVIASYGVGPLLVREIAAQPIAERPGFLSAIGLWAARVTGTLCICSMVIVLAWLSSSYGSPPTSTWIERLAVVGIIPMYLAVILICSTLGGLHRVGKGQAVENAIKNGLLLLGACLLLFVGARHAADVLWLQVASWAVAGVVGVYWIMRVVRSSEAAEEPARASSAIARPARKALHGSWRKAAGHFFVMSVAILLLVRLDVVIVNAVAGSAQAGLFGAAARLGQFGTFAGLVWIAWLQPRMARQSRSRKKADLKRSLRLGTFGSAGMTAVLVGLGWWLAPRLMGLMGSGFGGAVWPFRWLLIGSFVWALAVPSYAFLAMSGREKPVSAILWCQLILTLAAAVPLAGAFGALGAAWAWAGGSAVTGLAMVVSGLFAVRQPIRQGT